MLGIKLLSFEVVGYQLMLINYNSNDGMFPFFLKQDKVGLHLLGIMIIVVHLDANGWNSDIRMNDCFRFIG